MGYYPLIRSRSSTMTYVCQQTTKGKGWQGLPRKISQTNSVRLYKVHLPQLSHVDFHSSSVSNYHLQCSASRKWRNIILSPIAWMSSLMTPMDHLTKYLPKCSTMYVSSSIEPPLALIMFTGIHLGRSLLEVFVSKLVAGRRITYVCLCGGG